MEMIYSKENTFGKQIFFSIFLYVPLPLRVSITDFYLFLIHF